MFNKHQTDSDKAARKSEAKESELRAWFAATIAEMEESTARRVEFAEASTARAKQEGETQAQDLQHQLNIAIERFETTVWFHYLCKSVPRQLWWTVLSNHERQLEITK